MKAMKYTARRIRFDVKLRMVQVVDVQRVTPRMARITLGGDALDGFISAAHDDHVKLFFPQPGQEKPLLPSFGPNGPVFPEGAPRPIARDYTPRRLDGAWNTLVIDFSLHGDGPAASWAAQAQAGQFVGVGGPRGSFIVPNDFDWYLLIGDETALPAIGRRLEELPGGTQAIVIAEVADADEEQRFISRAQIDMLWLHRDEAAPGTVPALVRAMADLDLPPGDGTVWLASEAATAKALHRHFTLERGLRKDRVRASAYWKQGAVAMHESYHD